MVWVGLGDINLSGVALVESKKKSQPDYGVCNLVNIMKARVEIARQQIKANLNLDFVTHRGYIKYCN